MEHYRLKTENDGNYVHCVSPFQEDMSLCFHDLAGDEELGWDTAEKTKDKIDCPDCIKIIKYCKIINKKNYI